MPAWTKNGSKTADGGVFNYTMGEYF